MDVNSDTFLTDIEQALAAGRIDHARDKIEQFRIAQGKPESYFYATGLLNLVSHDPISAIQAFTQSEKIFADSPKFHNNFGKAFLDNDQAQQALTHFEKAVELNSNYAIAKYNLACCHIQLENGHEAQLFLDELLQQESQFANYLSARADAARIQNRYQEAILWYRKALQQDSNHVGANSNISVLLVAFGQEKEALEFAKRAVKLTPKNYLTHFNLGRCLANLEDYDEAMDSFADAFEIQPDSDPLVTEIAEVWKTAGNYQEAGAWYQKGLELNPDNTKALAGIARILLETNQLQAALVMLEEKLETYPDDSLLKRAYADAVWDDGDVSKAIDILKGSVEGDQDNPALLAKVGQMLASAGEVDNALAQYEKALDLNPKCIPALNGLAVKQKSKLDTRWVEQIETLLQSKHLKEISQAQLHNALAYYYDGQKQWKTAAEHMAAGNALQWQHQSKRSWDYDSERNKRYIQLLKNTFTAEYFAQLDNSVSTDQTPVFIVGMPRSGTTLTEQILARHPSVLGIGERNFASQALQQIAAERDDQDPLNHQAIQALPHINPQVLKAIGQQYLQRLEALKEREDHQQAIRVVDKMPDNYSLMGWITTLFPQAKIIHCRRHPRDVALSCWITHFGSIQWASQMPHLVDRIHGYQDIMAHWREVMPDRFIEVNYEDMVNNQEQESRRLIDWIGLDWDPACMKFYESDRVVRTASITQVREPIYKRSVARWEPYAEFIPGLNDIRIPD